MLIPDVFFCKALKPIAVLLNPVVLFCKALQPIAVLYAPEERGEVLKAFVAPIDMFVETFPLPLLKSTPLIEPVTVKDPITPKDPVICALPVYGNGEDTFNAKEAVVAHDAVPNKEPVIEPVTFKEPEMFTVFVEKFPPINGVPGPQEIYNLLLSSVNVEGPAPNPSAILFEELPEKRRPAFCPNAILFNPIVLQNKALRPIAVLLVPVVFLFKAVTPIAVLLVPVVLENKDPVPIQTLPLISLLKTKLSVTSNILHLISEACIAPIVLSARHVVMQDCNIDLFLCAIYIFIINM